MAKKVVVPEEGKDENNKPKKKKRNKCCTCCLIVVILLVVILAAAFGVGWYFGNLFTEETLGMSLGDVFGVLGDMYWADDEDVVERPFGAEDLNGFYKEIKRNIMLKEDAEVDFDGALQAAIDRMFAEDQNGARMSAVKKSAARDYEYFYIEDNTDEYPSDDGDGNIDNSDDSTSQITDILINTIIGALNRDNIDEDRLNRYNENDPSTDEYIFNLNDKQLAAFVDAVLRAVLANADKLDDFKEYAQMVDLPNAVALKQIVFATVKDGDSVKATTAKVTAWIALQSAAGQAATHFIEDAGMGWVAPLARGMCNMILPKNLYVSITIPLYGDVDPYININDMNDEERARAYKLINNIMSNDGSDDALTDMLRDFTDGLKPMLEAATEHMNFDGVDGTGTVSVDLIDTAIKMAMPETEGESLTKADFLYVLQALMSEPDEQLAKLEPYMFTDRYLIDGEEVYIKGGDSMKTPIDYESRFIDEIEDKYSLDFGESTKLDDVLAMLGVSLDGSDNGSMGSQELLGLIDAQKFNQSLDRSLQELTLVVTDRMLGAAMSGQMNKIIANGEDLAAMDLKLDALSFVTKTSKPNNLYAQLAVEADMSGLFDSFGDDSLVTQLAMGLMPPQLLFTVTVDITRNLQAGEQRDGVEFILNSCENTDRALAALEKLVPSLDLNSLSEQIGTTFNDMLDQMYKMLDIRLVASTYHKDGNNWVGTPGALEMPDIFTVVTDMVLIDDNGERVVSPTQLKSVLRGINDTSGVDVSDGIAQNYSGFIGQIVDKYYLAPAQNDKLETLDDITKFMSAFDTNKFRMWGDDPDVYYMAYDKRTVSQLKPIMSGPELGALIKEQMGANVEDYAVESVATGTDSLSVILSINVGNLLPDDVKFLLVSDKVYVTATVDMSQVEGDGSDNDPLRYSVGVNVNSMDSATYSSMLKLVRFFQPDFDIAEQVNEFGKILYEQMRNINNSFAASDSDVTVAQDFFEFTYDGLVMTDFYTFLASKMGVVFNEDTTPDDVKAALQGMYVKSSVTNLQNDNNYVVDNIIFNRGGTVWSGGLIPTGEHSDHAFNAYLKDKVAYLDGVTMEQTIILASNNSDTAAAEARSWLGGHLGITLDPDLDYLAATVSMSMDDYMTGSDNSGGFLPVTAVYGTLVYKYENGVFESIGIIFNDMGTRRFNVLQQLMNLSPDSSDPNKININSVSDATEEILNAVAEARDITFGGRINNEGIGSVVTVEKSA